VRSLEQLAKEHLPLVRDKNGLEKRLELEQLAKERDLGKRLGPGFGPGHPAQEGVQRGK